MCGGACETIQDGLNGFHVEPHDSIALAQKIEHCLSLIGSAQEKNMTMNAIQCTRNIRIYNLFFTKREFCVSLNISGPPKIA